jgi:cytochrome o ubiquinol oxidase operon protein cyoD
MSAHADPHAPHDGAVHAHGTRRSYLTGFALSVLLTAIPFWLVMSGAMGSNQATGLLIMALAVVQIVVHMIFFLHMDTKAEGGWSFMALLFTVVLVVIALSGSLWVMYHLNHNMMPVTAHDMSQMP